MNKRITMNVLSLVIGIVGIVLAFTMTPLYERLILAICGLCSIYIGFTGIRNR